LSDFREHVVEGLDLGGRGERVVVRRWCHVEFDDLDPGSWLESSKSRIVRKEREGADRGEDTALLGR
jgi:hypothetical protein